MQWRNTPSRYGFVAASLHWIIVAGIIAQYFLAEAAEDQEKISEGVTGALSVHNALGITLLALALIRLVWRLVEPPPAMPPTMKRHEAAFARTVHWAFYVLLFAIPISGWALATIEGHSVSFFGLFDLAPLKIAAGSEDLFEEVHEVLFNILVGLAVVHVLAALKHHWLDRDNVLRSMLAIRRP